MIRMAVKFNKRLVGNNYITASLQKDSGSNNRHHRSNDLLEPLIPPCWTSTNRRYGMYVARIFKEAIKLRYLLLGGAAYCGMILKAKYEDFVDSLPDLKSLREALGDKLSQFSKTLIKTGTDVKDFIKSDTVRNGVNTLKNEYENCKDCLPAFKSLTEASGDKWSQFSNTLIKTGGALKDYIQIDPRVLQLGEEKCDKMKQGFEKCLRLLKYFCLFLFLAFLCLVIF